ncbi:hypothetical protein [Cohnella terricola]|uniref:HTH luxR-type domain-containing protein n=1 Tax=Cohnella terricola TaxID=1289167 RepID=A0A559JQQ8_9BACL|nr:hypothetical protein [Cohnella terricola]TVY02214.1 hypothetical protein FPZ45_07195 [Cohnella terricola]
MLLKESEWQVVSTDNAKEVKFCEAFGDRYHFTASEKEVMRLGMLIGLNDEEIISVMRISTRTLNNLIACMIGKTRTHSLREIQALFLRYILQKLPN